MEDTKIQWQGGKAEMSFSTYHKPLVNIPMLC